MFDNKTVLQVSMFNCTSLKAKKNLYKVAISIFAHHRGRYAHAYGICARLYCNSLKNIWGGKGYNAARGLISRDIANAVIHNYFANIPKFLKNWIFPEGPVCYLGKNKGFITRCFLNLIFLYKHKCKRSTFIKSLLLYH